MGSHGKPKDIRQGHETPNQAQNIGPLLTGPVLSSPDCSKLTHYPEIVKHPPSRRPPRGEGPAAIIVVRMLARAILATLLLAAAAWADPSPLVPGDPLACFNRMDGAGTLS